MTTYETWDEMDPHTNEVTTATDAPAGIVVVPLAEYDRVREAIRSAEQFQEDYLTAQVDGFGKTPRDVRAYCNGMSQILGIIRDELKRAALQEAGDECHI